VTKRVELPESHLTACEGANLHLADLKTRAKDFDPLTCDRFLAGALIPASLYAQAQRFRSWYRARVAELFRDVDVLLASTASWVAPLIGAPRLAAVAGVDIVARSHSGVFTQPLSFIGLPVISVPLATPGSLPLGVMGSCQSTNPAIFCTGATPAALSRRANRRAGARIRSVRSALRLALLLPISKPP
jgi:Asp-tRNA(Asn)/Glu-tRNA(Gln) amidotransferase A subunit family amidase